MVSRYVGLAVAFSFLGCSPSAEVGDDLGEPAAAGSEAPVSAPTLEAVRALRAVPQFAPHLREDATLERVGAGFRLAGHADRETTGSHWVPAGGSLDVTLPASARSPLRLAVSSFDGLWVEVTSEDGRDVAGEALGGAVVLSDVAEDTDVVHMAELGRAEEIRLLKSERASTTARYTLHTGPDVDSVHVSGDRIELVDESGRARIRSESLFVVDANQVERRASATVSGSGDTWSLAVSFDATGLTYPIALDPAWISAAAMEPKIGAAGVARLLTGEVLYAGGYTLTESPTAAAMIYDPQSDAWSPVNGMANSRPSARLTTMTNGDVLATGIVSVTDYLSAEVYYAGSGVWAGTQLAPYPLGYHVAVALPGSKVFVASGNFQNFNYSDAAIYDAATNGWTSVQPMSEARAVAEAVLLPSGKVLVAGGSAGTFSVPYVAATAELYDPVLDEWSSAGSMTTPRTDGFRLVLLPSGKVMAAGGNTALGDPSSITASVDIYDPATNQWTAAQPMGTARSYFALVTLPTGKTLAAGNGSTHVFNEATGLWTMLDPPPLYGNAPGTLLLDGSVFIGPAGIDPYNNCARFWLRPLGTACSGPTDCDSNFCADGVCCNSMCIGQCQSCNLPGTAGTCTPVTGAPVGGRNACKSDSAAPVCNGTCDGVTTSTCVYPTSSCRAQSCTDGVQTQPASCDGNGKCPVLVTQSCGGYACQGTICGNTCAGDADCDGTHYCLGTSCVPKLVQGDSCSTSNQCLSNFCTDGVCCETSCGGQCERCDAAGVCVAVTTGQPQGNRLPCATDGTVCGGTCATGNRATCTYDDVTVQCRTGSCANDVATLAGYCDGAGACPPVQTASCSPLKCNGTTCDANCSSDAECQAGYYCDAVFICRPKLGPGEGCQSSNQCSNGYCVDGVCCNGTCPGQCEACDVPGSLGICSPIPANDVPHGSRPLCGSDGTVCGGYCDGSNPSACIYPGSGQQCRAETCANSTATLAAYCSGTGSCPSLRTQPCGQYICGATKCEGDCVTAPCQTGYYCSGGICMAKGDNGVACSGPDDCTSGICVDSVCCNTACTGQCEACDLPGPTLGTCTTLTSGGPRGSRAECPGSGTCAATCDGTSATSCGYPGATKICVAATCSGGQATEASVCDGNGGCTMATTSDCGAYTCDTDACRTSCTSVVECEYGNLCTNNQCVPASTDAGTEAGAAGAGGNAAGGGSGAEGGAGAPSGSGGASGSGAEGGAGAAANAGAGAGGPGASGAGGGGAAGSGFEEPPVGSEGGCGCRVAGERASDRSVATLGALLGFALAARRLRGRGQKHVATFLGSKGGS